MAAFWGYEFMYDNTLSSKFGLYIADINNSGADEQLLSAPVNYTVKKIPNRSKVYHIGVEVDGNGTYEFELSFFREADNPILASERNAIAHWLSGGFKFKQLKIIQDDMCSAYYNCYFKNIRYHAITGYANGFSATVVCDAPFAWGNPKTIEKHFVKNANDQYPNITELQLYNLSSDHNLTVPQLIEIDLGENENEFKIINTSNNNEFFEFKNLVVGDKIRINDLYIIECLTRPNTVIVDNFYGEFLRLINGVNNIRIEGQIKRFKIIWQSGVKIG